MSRRRGTAVRLIDEKGRAVDGIVVTWSGDPDHPAEIVDAEGHISCRFVEDWHGRSPSKRTSCVALRGSVAIRVQTRLLPLLISEDLAIRLEKFRSGPRLTQRPDGTLIKHPPYPNPSKGPGAPLRYLPPWKTADSLGYWRPEFETYICWDESPAMLALASLREQFPDAAACYWAMAYEGVSAKELAPHFGVSHWTVHTWKRRIATRIREILHPPVAERSEVAA